MNTLKNNPKMLWTLVCFALLCQTACTNTLKMGMDTEAEQLTEDLNALTLATAAAQPAAPQTETRTLNISDELIDSLQFRREVESGIIHQPEDNLAILKAALRRVRDRREYINIPIKLKTPITGWSIIPSLDDEWYVSVLAACLIVAKDPPIELIQALIQAGAHTHGKEVLVDKRLPLLFIATMNRCLSASRCLLENGAGVDISTCIDASSVKAFLSAIFVAQDSDDVKEALLKDLIHHGLDINQTDYMGNTELHKDYDSVELDMLLRVQGMHKSLYQSTTYGETPWETHVRVAAYHSKNNNDDKREKHLEIAEKLISAMDPHNILNKKTQDKEGNEQPTHYERFNTFLAIEDIPEDIKQRIEKAFALKKLAPWIIRKKTNVALKLDST